ncbi:MAG: hypothetical protein HC801_03015, partial [Nitrospira sp.]|nr:hypothetical protein [Nitrospira sp.]
LIGLGIAFLPAAALGLAAHGWIKSHLFTPQTVATTSILGGIIILIVEATKRTSQAMSLEQVSPIHAFWIGVAQCASLIPGMSRSGSTIIGGLLAGLDRKVATEYSFFSPSRQSLRPLSTKHGRRAGHLPSRIFWRSLLGWLFHSWWRGQSSLPSSPMSSGIPCGRLPTIVLCLESW